MSKPRHIWVNLASRDFDEGREEWGHRDIGYAVFDAIASFNRRLPSRRAYLGAQERWHADHDVETIATAHWFALRRGGWSAEQIVLMTTEGLGGGYELGAMRRALA